MAFFEAIDSMAGAIEHVIARKHGFTAIRRRRLSPEDRRYEFVKALALFGLKTAFDVRKRGGFVFGNRDIRRAFKEAVARNDLDFFKSVGRVLSREQVTVAKMEGKVFDQVSKLETFLISYWVVEEGADQPLCFMTMRELAKRCYGHGISPIIDQKTIHTTRTRLGLIPVKSFKYRGPGLPRVPGLGW